MAELDEGDIIIGKDGGEIVLGKMLAYQGKEDCTDVRCTRLDGKCAGYHCPVCHKPCSMMGHKACRE